MSSQFEPINNAHAISEVVFYAQFEPMLDLEAIRDLLTIEYELKEWLPVVKELREFQLTVKLTKDGSQTSSNLDDERSGLEMRAISDEDRDIWLLKAIRNAVSVHCLDYSQWKTIWKQGSKGLLAALTKIDLKNFSVLPIGLRYIDRFIYQGDVSGYDLTTLFKQDSGLLVDKAFESGELWHSNSGWFDDIFLLEENSVKCLNQLNISSEARSSQYIVTIDHNATLHLTDKEIHQMDTIESLLNGAMDILHSQNKLLLNRLLVTDMSKRINLGVNKDL